MATVARKTGPQAESAEGVRRWAGQMIVALLIYGILLFFAAGRLAWQAGWMFLGMNILTMGLSMVVLVSRRPGLLAERSQIREGTKGWDRILTPAVAIFGPLAIIGTAGLDARFGWSVPFSGIWGGAGLVLAFGCQMFVLWAMVSNPFFATTVRIQAERGHSVISGGPYRLVRHPGYLGSVIYNLACPLLLGSLWTFLPASLAIVLILLRTGLEDRTLRAELPGYPEYATRVRYRLIPGVW